VPARVVRGEINSSRSLSRVSLLADLCFRSLIVAVDDFGRTEADPLMLKAALFPRRPDVTPEQVSGWVRELREEGCVQVYTVDGVNYLAMTGWERHRGNSRRGASKFPAPPEQCKESPGKSRKIQEAPGIPRKILSGVGVESRSRSREEELLSEEEPLKVERPGRSPLLNLLRSLPGDDAEKTAWLSDTGPQIEVDSAEKGSTVRSLTVRYYRRYLQGERRFQNAAEEAERAAKRRAWQEQHGEAYDEELRETGGVS